MIDDAERAGVADARETTQPDWVPPGRADLERRLDQMAAKNPSSTRYDTADGLGRADGEDMTDPHAGGSAYRVGGSRDRPESR